MVRVVFLGDIHVGSNYAVFPPNWTNPESGNIVNANEFQRKLYEYWCRYAEELRPDILILMGDIIEGPQTREKFGTLTILNIQHQIDAALKLIQVWKWKELYVIRGTDYHVAERGMHAEEIIARELGAVKSSKWGDRYSSIDLALEVEDVAIHVAHHVGVSTVPHYQFTPIVREGWLYKLYDQYHGRFNLIVRGHVHYCRIAEVSDEFIIATTPCWQLPTPYQKKKSSFILPDLGVLLCDINGNELVVKKRIIRDPKFKPHRIRSDVKNEVATQ
ncbi:MAG: hypothetical protein QW555_07945 [Nitrososphaerota archaeon]